MNCQTQSLPQHRHRYRSADLLRLLAPAALIALACASAPPGRSGEPSDLLPVGVAAVDITPEQPIRLTGYGNRATPSTGVGQRLWAKAIAIGGDRPAVLIAVDLIGVPLRLTTELAGRLERAGVPRAQLAIAATHTHTGPSLSGVLPFIFSTPLTPAEQVAVERYSTGLVDRLERAALAALADRRPARLAWGQGSAAFAANRRVLKDGKWVTFGVAPGAPVDHDLPILTARAPDGTLRAVLANYACHATTLEARDNIVHGDWPGAAKVLIEQRHPGAVALITVGAGADANPDPRGGGPPTADRHGREVADEVDRLLGTALRPVTTAPSGGMRLIDLRLHEMPDRAAWESRAAGAGAPAIYARSVLARLDRGESLPPTVPYPVQVWSFGRDLAMVFLAGEVVADYGLRLKKELDGTRLWVTAYANDVPFYVPSQRMIPEGGYEVEGSMVYYGQPSRLADGTEEQIVNTVRALVPDAFTRR